MSRIKWLLILARDVLSIPLIVLFPRNNKKILFGAWSGKQYSCNPKYLFEYMVKRGGFNCIWIGEEHLRSKVLALNGAKFARKGSFVAFWHYLTARFYVCNVQWRSDIANIPRCRRVHLLYLTHGNPDKRTGDKQFGGNGEVKQIAVKRGVLRKALNRLLCRLEDFLYGQQSWCSVNSPQGKDIRLYCMSFRLSAEKILECGTPRADWFIQNADNAALKQKFRVKFAQELQLPLDKKWYLFVPTWRHEEKYLFSFSASSKLGDYEKLLRAQNAILIEKQHPIVLERMKFNTNASSEVYIIDRDRAREINTQELLLACDRLITDYSSIYYDFVLMNRPVLHFTYDFDHFMNKDMGFMFDIRDYGGGPFAYTEDELLKFMAQSDEELLAQRSPRTKAEQLTWETGHACEGYYDLIEKLSRQKGYFVQ